MHENVADVRARVRDYATLRITVKMREQVERMAAAERRTLSQMLRILVEEALDARTKVPASNAAD